jgi:hypothetical protein
MLLLVIACVLFVVTVLAGAFRHPTQCSLRTSPTRPRCQGGPAAGGQTVRADRPCAAVRGNISGLLGVLLDGQGFVRV